MQGDLTDRFWAKVDKSGECWTWRGLTSASGYGIGWMNGQRAFAHRVAWTVAHGPIPAGMHVLHRCDNPPCVRPDHLFVGTQADNMRDMAAKGRSRSLIPRGSANPNSKLSAEDVRAIRCALAAAEPMAAIARRFGVRPQSIEAIRNGKSWKWLDAA